MANFTKKQKEKLISMCKKDVISIKGITGYGNEFVANNARITVNKDQTPAVDNDVIFAEFGTNGEKMREPQTPFYAPFITDLYGYLDETFLYLDQIADKSGNVIYKNSNYESIKDTLLQMKAKRDEFYENSQNVAEKKNEHNKLDNVSKNLVKYFGNPVCVDGLNGILLGYDDYDYSGEPIFRVATGTLIYSGKVNKNSKLEAFDGNQLKVVANNAEEKPKSTYVPLRKDFDASIIANAQNDDAYQNAQKQF
jgi:hypothetical protein